MLQRPHQQNVFQERLRAEPSLGPQIDHIDPACTPDSGPAQGVASALAKAADRQFLHKVQQVGRSPRTFSLHI